MRILLLGKNGQLGWECQRSLACLGEVMALDYPEIDFTHPETLPSQVKTMKPDVIINAAAYTAVDRAESEPETARAINTLSPWVLAEAACRLKSALIHISSDFVFDGKKGSPYTETDPPNPLSYYGQSKLNGDLAVLAAGGSTIILRTSWVYGRGRESFVTKVLQWGRKQTTLKVVTDQISNPTWARMLAEAIAVLVARSTSDPFGWFSERAGLYHLAGSGFTSRFEWAKAILELDPQRAEQVVQNIEPALTSDFPTPAARPLFSALACDKFEATFGLRLPPWKNALKMALEA